ncbi:winged helix-turn-helix transcriptional regulator [Blastococcus sp. SYSU D00820]
MALQDALALVGDRWALLVVREVALGVRRFSDLQASTGAPRSVLAERLRRLVAAGVLDRSEYVLPGARARQEYRLTPAGLDLLPVLAAFSDWAARHLPDDRPADVTYRHGGCGGHVGAHLVCDCGADLTPGDRLVASVLREEPR